MVSWWKNGRFVVILPNVRLMFHPQSLRIAPPSSHPTSTTNTATSKLSSSSSSQTLERGPPSAPGLPDSLRQSPSSHPSTTTSAHPLEARLSAWRATQDALKLETLRRTY